MSFDNPKLKQNADLVVPFSACPFGEPVDGCPFIPYYKLNDERVQILKIIDIPQEKLDEMRTFHRTCRDKLMKTRKVQFPERWY